jgi:alcohol dehydrogenase class IV
VISFEFATASRIIFGPGSLAHLPELARSYGEHALLVTGQNTGRAAPLVDELNRSGISLTVFTVGGEPTLDDTRRGAETARNSGCGFVISFGGGSATDAAKAIAALATNSGEPLDYLEVIGKGEALTRPPLPCIAIPTTAGTGAEVTRNAVLGSPQHGLKASLRGPFLLPKAAIVDPKLTIGLPQQVTATSGLDALTQLIEAFTSCRAQPFTDMFCRTGLVHIRSSLRAAFHDGKNLSARESMSFAALLSGLALANAGLGIVHGFAAPLGGMLHAPHGALCAAVLPYAVETNIHAVRQRAPEHPALGHYREIAHILTANERAEPEDLGPWLLSLTRDLGIASLSGLGLQYSQIPELVEKTAKANSTKANPLALTKDEITGIAERAL